MDLRTRPYTYSETSQLDLDSFVLYTTSITIDVSNYICTLIFIIVEESKFFVFLSPCNDTGDGNEKNIKRLLFGYH